MPMRAMTAIFCLLFASAACAAGASDPAGAQLEAAYRDTIHPFIQTYCVSCHNSEKHKGDFDLSIYSTMAPVAHDERQWGLVLERLEAGEMPPEKAKLRPTPQARLPVIEWVRAMRKYEAQRN